ncbi:DNA polymerase delta subunit 3-like [Schistocerca gregaria]|uniref:DNA polymerase delta subunit 3-like n=1 Tax=Schistocerca gregaria TaxID=7010 RepID=UPI00211E0ABB|nr:DNA polymerase delta subunit 3-like [Schistocerca gregaria]
MLKDDNCFDQLDQLIFKDQKIITYRWLSKKFNVPSTFAKQILYQFSMRNENKLCLVYFLSGLRRTDHEHIIELVPESKLQATEKNFECLISKHIYSVSAAIPNDSNQIWLNEKELSRSLPSELMAYIGSAISYHQSFEDTKLQKNVQTDRNNLESRFSTVTDMDSTDLIPLVKPIVTPTASPNLVTAVGQGEVLVESKYSKPIKGEPDEAASPSSSSRRKTRMPRTLTQMFSKITDQSCRSAYGSPNVEPRPTSSHVTTLQAQTKDAIASPGPHEIVLSKQADQKRDEGDNFDCHLDLDEKALLDDLSRELNTEFPTQLRNRSGPRRAKEHESGSVISEKNVSSVQKDLDTAKSEKHAKSSTSKAPPKEQRLRKKRVQKTNSANSNDQSGIDSTIERDISHYRQRDMFDRYFSRSKLDDSKGPPKVNDAKYCTDDSVRVHRITKSETFVNDRGYIETKDVVELVKEENVPGDQEVVTNQAVESKDANPLPRESRSNKMGAALPFNPEKSRTIETFFKKS